MSCRQGNEGTTAMPSPPLDCHIATDRNFFLFFGIGAKVNIKATAICRLPYYANISTVIKPTYDPFRGNGSVRDPL